MNLDALKQQICPVSREAADEAGERWNSIGKPLHSLGKLEDIIIKISGIKQTSVFELERKVLIVMCADNGIVSEGVTQAPQNVTATVARNFLGGKTCTSRMAKRAGVDVFPVDIGIVSDVPGLSAPESKIACGTKNFAEEPAMSRKQVEEAIMCGVRIAREKKEQGYDILLTGEMGIGNTSTSSAVAAALLGKDASAVTGRGAGLDGQRLAKKQRVIREALDRYGLSDGKELRGEEILDVLSKVGGLDIAGLVGVCLGGAICQVPVVIDGFISAVAALSAVRMIPEVSQYLIASHVSKEPAGELVLDALGISPVITADLSLGEGSGAVALMPLIDMALDVYLHMSTFDEINVDQYQEYDT